VKKLIGLLIAIIVVTGLLLVAGCGSSELLPELNDNTWVSPSKVEMGNFTPGASAEYELNIHNGKDEPAEFSVTYRVPSSPASGFVTAPEEAQDWVTIADPSPVLEAKETRQVLIAVEIPEGATAPAKWEFWIVVKDVSQGGMVQTELASRWLITMK
jgi:uncharacterized membrane protein